MNRLQIVALQSLLTLAVVYGFTFNGERTIFVAKGERDGSTAYRISKNRLSENGFDQITGDNRDHNELSFFSAYDQPFRRKNIGSWLDPEYEGGFDHKMRVCMIRHSNGEAMFLLTSRSCRVVGANAHEQFNFYVSPEDRDEYQMQRIYYAACQTKQSRYVYMRISSSYVNCGRDNWMGEGSFWTTVPQGYACNYLQAPDGTTINYEYNRGRITGANLRCNPGYRIRGSSYRECSTSGRWSGSGAACQPITCGNPRPNDARMRPVTEGPYRFEDWVRFECPAGYELFPAEAQAQCQLNGQWFYQPAECKVIDCPYPGEPRHGTTIATEGYQVEATIRYRCNRGYRLEGPSRAECTRQGQWEPNELPICSEVRCPPLTQPQNGRYHGSDSRFVLDQEAIFQCDSGYSLVGDQVLTCQFNQDTLQGKWSAPIPTCSQIRCRPPAEPQNGAITGSDFSYGAQISFRCDAGFIMTGSDVATCLNDGNWDAAPPTCNVIRCRDPGTPEHATRVGGTFTYMSVINYRCDVGYRRRGSDTIVCTENGRWSSKLPECEPVGCGEMVAPKFGSKEGDSYTYGSHIQFSCFPGYEIDGANETECLYNGEWSEPQPACKPCGYRFYKESYGTESCIKCPVRSYTTSEASTSLKHCLCEADTHGPPGGPCEAIECTFPAPLENGEVGECGTENNDICSFRCNPGYILEGTRTRTCTTQGWTGHLPVCVACPANTYKRDEGSLSCTPCPQNSYIPEGTLGVGAQSCVCRAGFERGMSGDCQDMDECAVNNGGCEDECMNTPGSFVCKCTTGGYELTEDGRSCYQANTCSSLTEAPENGYLNCKRYDESNGVTCWLRCDPGYFFVSGLNDYVTCGPGTSFEWSHKLVNKTNLVPACTKEFFVDILLPINSTYEAEESCNSLAFSPDMLFEKMRVQEFISTLQECIDPSKSGKYCEAKNLAVKCDPKTSENDDVIKSVISVTFDLVLKNKEGRPLNATCNGPCQRKNLRGILGSAVSLTKELQELIAGKAIGVDVGNGELKPIVNTDFIRPRPNLMCIEPGHVLTAKRLCVPCGKGTYLALRANQTCTPCPVGTYQNQISATSCKPCLPGSTTLTYGTPSPHMCNVLVTEYRVNTTDTDSNPPRSDTEEDDGPLDLDSFDVPF